MLQCLPLAPLELVTRRACTIMLPRGVDEKRSVPHTPRTVARLQAEEDF